MHRIAIPLLSLVLAACSVGQGRGRVEGSVLDTICEVDEPEYSMNPSFFSSDIIEDRGGLEGTRFRNLTIRIQRGSYRESDSDGLMVLIPDVNAIKSSMLGVPIALTADAAAPVQMTLYLNQTCDAGFPREFWTIPGVYEAQSGTITFDAIYAPDIASTETEITAHFEDVVFADPTRDDRVSLLSGDFSFQHQRGRPAQPFP